MISTRTLGLSLSLIILVGFTVFLCSQSLIKFLHYPTFMASAFEDQRTGNFPDLTFCLHSSRTSSSNSEAGMNQSQIPDDDYWFITEYIYVRHFQLNLETQRTNLILGPKHDGDENLLQIRNHPFFEKCITFHASDQIKDLGIYYLRLNSLPSLTLPFVVFMHSGDDFWHTTLNTPGIVVYPNVIKQVQVNYEDVRTLPSDVRNCTYLGRDQCLENHLKMALKSALNCKPDWLDNLDLVTCSDWKLPEAKRIVQKAMTDMKDVCQLPCHFLNVNSGSGNAAVSKPGDTRFYAYFPYKITISKEEHLISFLKLVAEGGGYAGLLLGVSFYHLVRAGTYLLEKITRRHF